MRKNTPLMLAFGAVIVGTATIIIVQQRQIAALNNKLAHPTRTAARPANATNSVAHALTADNADLAHILAIPDRLERLRALLNFTAGLNAADLFTVLQQMAKESKSLRGDNDLALSMLVARLVQLDPKGALAWANTQVQGPARQRILQDLFTEWSSLDPAAALAGIATIANISERAEFERLAFASMAGRDPAAALKILLSLPPGEQTHDNYDAIFSNWAAVDPASAAAAVLSLPNSRNRDFAIENVLQGWAQVDPAGALAWAATLTGGVRASALSTALGNLAQQNPQAAVAYLNSLTNAADRNTLLPVLADNWGKVDPAGALAWVNQNSTGQAHDSAMLNLLGQLSQTDPATAASLIGNLPERMQVQAVTQIATNWATQNIQSAMAWVQSQPTSAAGGNPYKQLEVNMINNFTNTNPAAAAAYVQTIQGNPLFGRLVEQVAANWVQSDPTAAMAWAQSLSPDAGGNNAMLQVITQYTKTDAQAAWTMAVNLPDSELRDQTMDNVFGKWAAQNPATAASQLASLPDADQTTATNQLAQAWLNQDPQAAEQWINTLPTGAPRDQAITQLISIEGSNDLPTAFTWATTISDSAVSNAQLNRVVQLWAQKDPTAAAAAVQAANISDNQRTSMLSLISRYTSQATN